MLTPRMRVKWETRTTDTTMVSVWMADREKRKQEAYRLPIDRVDAELERIDREMPPGPLVFINTGTLLEVTHVAAVRASSATSWDNQPARWSALVVLDDGRFVEVNALELQAIAETKPEPDASADEPAPEPPADESESACVVCGKPKFPHPYRHQYKPTKPGPTPRPAPTRVPGPGVRRDGF